MRKWNTFAFLTFVAMTAASCRETTIVAQSPHEFYIQNGFQGYSGANDVVVTRLEGFVPEPGSIMVDSYKYRPLRSLIHFDLSKSLHKIPCDPKLDVVKAVLYLHRYKQWVITGGPVDMAIQLYSFPESHKSFLQGANFDAATGYTKPEMDNVFINSGHPGNVRQWMAFNLSRSLVQKWICDPSSNKGMVLKSGSEEDSVLMDPRGYANFFSSNATTDSAGNNVTELRPMLYIEFSDTPNGVPGEATKSNPGGRTAAPSYDPADFEPLRKFELLRDSNS
ncbi:MAG: hypothetical protein JNL01_02210 [Bdellovibrionales bacterium]|nr:hypothetical protein [Bdellovibrionales bacterium]